MPECELHVEIGDRRAIAWRWADNKRSVPFAGPSEPGNGPLGMLRGGDVRNCCLARYPARGDGIPDRFQDKTCFSMRMKLEHE